MFITEFTPLEEFKKIGKVTRNELEYYRKFTETRK
jgi:hypothetical protein